MRASERLLARLREIGLDLPEGTKLRRVHPSAAMRNLGAWSWCALGPDGTDLHIGSRHPMSELLASDELIAHTDGNGSYTDPDINITTPEWMD